MATEFANIFNQESIWDFSKGDEIKLNSSPERVDYEEAIRELRRFLRNLSNKNKSVEEKLIDYSYARKLARKNNLDRNKLEVIIDMLNDGAIDDPSYVRKVVDSKDSKEIEKLILSHYE